LPKKGWDFVKDLYYQQSDSKSRNEIVSLLEFELFAPYNESVELIGNWSDWQPISMTRGEDGGWRTPADLEDGDYEYQFELISLSPALEGKRIPVGDPTSLRLTGQGRTRLVVRNGAMVATDYSWQDAESPLAQNHELIFYEIDAGALTATWALVKRASMFDPKEHNYGYHRLSLFARTICAQRIASL